MDVKELHKNFSSRAEISNYVAGLAPWLKPSEPSQLQGGQTAAIELLDKIDPVEYCKNRNFLDGDVTRLSAYIRHGVLTLSQVRDFALKKCEAPAQIEKFIQQLAWRDYFQRVYDLNPEWIWQDIETYKTGFKARDYQNELVEDIREGRTGIACMDSFIHTLITTGYLHNHARLYLAAYVIHWRRIKWQAGAAWFLHYLVDGDLASNNFSWQWVASTFSHKPYFFNLENVRKYAAGTTIDCSPENNAELDASYEELSARLFPNKEAFHE